MKNICLVVSKNGAYRNLSIAVSSDGIVRHYPLQVVGKGGIDSKRSYGLWMTLLEDYCEYSDALLDSVDRVVYPLLPALGGDEHDLH